MNRPRICGVIVDTDLAEIKAAEPLVDLFEVRIDLVGERWQDIARRLEKPWIACNRRAEEGGKWKGSEAARVAELLKAVEMGADIIDIELRTENLAGIPGKVGRKSRLLVSYHDLEKTPTLDAMKDVVRKQLEAGADICKVVTTTRSFEDNSTVLQLIKEFPGVKMVSFAMGTPGQASRILCPLVGGEFTYASIETGKESAAGQITVAELRRLYDLLA